MTPIIQTKQLTHIYSPGTPFEHAALKGIDLTVDPGEYLAIIGRTGSGKSTLIQHLNGLLRPTSGQVLFDGEDIWSSKERTRQVRFQVGLVFQYPEYQLFEETVYRDIAFGPTNMGLSPDEVDHRVRQAARFVGLEDHTLEQSPFDLSGGQKRRVAIAGVIAMEPKVLILDEPTAGLDPRGRDDLLNKLKALHEGRGLTIILVSHSMEDVARFADRLMVMNHGEKVFDGTPKEVFHHYKELEKIGLAAPQITYLVHDLRDMGLEIDPDITTVEKKKKAILKLYCNIGDVQC